MYKREERKGEREERKGEREERKGELGFITHRDHCQFR